MKALKFWWLFCVVVVFSVACGGEPSPVEVVRSFMNAIESFDVDNAQSLVCPAQRAEIQESLNAFDNVNELGEAFALRLEDLTVQEKSNDGEIAIVHVNGTLTISFLGQQETQVIDEEHVVVKRDGRWLVCDP